MNNFQNRTLYHGDNLDFLRGMNSKTVHLIATDPPFNKNRDFHATPDSLAAGASFQDRWRWERDVHPAWVDAIKDDWPAVWKVIESARTAYGGDMAAFLCWLGVRLMEMYRILRDDGSIYLHTDDTAHAWVKCLMDSIFGKHNFRNEIIWERSAGRSDAKFFARVHDIILYYVKSEAAEWNQQYEPLSEEYITQNYRYEDAVGRYTTMPLKGGGVSGQTHEFTWRGVHARNWRFTQNSLEQLQESDLIHWSRKGRPRRKFYLSESKGVAARDIITNINRASSQERMGYPTQKPLALYERIIKASSNPGDMVLDPFCGCATTPIAAERLGRQWVGMDIWEGTYKIIRKRLTDIGFDTDEDSHLPSGRTIQYETIPPVRTDEDDEPAAPALVLKAHRVKAKWETLSHAEMRDILAGAQPRKAGEPHPVRADCPQQESRRSDQRNHRPTGCGQGQRQGRTMPNHHAMKEGRERPPRLPATAED